MSRTAHAFCAGRVVPSDVAADSENYLGNWTVALSESRGVGREVGIVGIEGELSRAVMSQLADSPTYVKTIHWLHQRPPCAILLVAPTSANSSSILQILLENTFPNTPVTSLPRSSFSSERGLSLLIDLASPGAQSTATIAEARPNYYALGAASALIDWLQDRASQTGHFGWEKGCLHVTWISIEGSMLIDKNTAVDLELITNLVSRKSKDSLFGLLDHTLTPMASRLLRRNILAPLTDVETIETRLNAVQELVDNEDALVSLRKALKPLGQMDVDKMIGAVASFKTVQSTTTESSERSVTISAGKSSLVRGKLRLQDPSIAITRKLEMLRSLKVLLDSLRAIRDALLPCTSRLLVLASEFLQDPALEEISVVIHKTVNQDSVIGVQKGGMAKQNIYAYAIKTDHENQLLDVARETYKENISDAISLHEDLRSTFKLPALGLKFETRAGFMLFIKKDELRATSRDSGYGTDGLPSIFTNVVNKGKILQFTCLDLKKKNQLIANSYEEICLLSNKALDEIVEQMKQRLSAFFRLSEAIATIDTLASFAKVATTHQYVRPEFTDTLAVSAGRHPIKERLDSDCENFIPNDTYASEACSFQLITGPNMSGKSVFLRQIALLTIMAQIGSYCPANYASFRIHDALLTCLSKNDDLEASLSTFASEMRTMSMILTSLSVCESALVIIDELGRGTSPLEGIGLAHAFSEEIIQTKSFCFFATHFRELITTLGVYPKVVSLHLETHVRSQGNVMGLDFQHRVLEGPTEQAGYGIELACISSLPKDVIGNAKKVMKKITESNQNAINNSRTSRVLMRRKIILDVYHALVTLAKYSQLPPAELRKHLLEFQSETVDQLQPDPTYEK
ncbi:hypothetical protein CROQUDRAFT_75045 [Cronartium quercuum f. sp. fusiforme G11]|uniref:DNA mismatch repair protein MSH3 n=1 Tax=Cronartium quercuum f. sp. fusiforme G11 TaxID=708437 RepID=A0A9P6NRD1_9BASI|nr:hypothetical protein CROQUDRAFT_75045 [Cronartium quercuum f. sp. fusiforme G11]